MKDKKQLIEELEQYHKVLNVRRLYEFPDHKNSKDWLAEVAAILKNLDESDYQEFMRLRQSIYSTVKRKTRREAALKIDCFVRQKVAEYSRYDFTNKNDWKQGKICLCIPIPKIIIPKWVKEHAVLIYTGALATVIGGIILYYFFNIRN